MLRRVVRWGLGLSLGLGLLLLAAVIVLKFAGHYVSVSVTDVRK